MVKVRIPTPLRPMTGGKSEVETQASDIQAMIESLNGQFPGLKSRICDDAGEIRRFVNIYLNEEDIRFMKGKDTPLKDGDQISIVPAIAGGAEESVSADSRAGGCNGAEESVSRARATASAGAGEERVEYDSRAGGCGENQRTRREAL